MTRTLLDKIFDQHVVVQRPGHPAVLYIDLHLIHEVTSPQAFDGLRQRSVPVRRPDRTIATMDHSTPTTADQASEVARWYAEPSRPRALKTIDAEAAHQLDTLQKNCAEHGIELFATGSQNNGIVHVIGPEQGRTLPGMTIVCGDSHTSTHGAFGAFALGIGTTEVEAVLATQCLLQRKPRSIEVRFRRYPSRGRHRQGPRPGADRAGRDRRWNGGGVRVHRRRGTPPRHGRAHDAV